MTYTEFVQMQKEAGMEKQALSPLLRRIGTLGKRYRFRKPRYSGEFVKVTDPIERSLVGSGSLAGKRQLDDIILDNNIRLNKKHPDLYPDAPLDPRSARNVQIEDYPDGTYHDPKPHAGIFYERDNGPSYTAPIWRDKDAFMEEATPLYNEWVKTRNRWR